MLSSHNKLRMNAPWQLQDGLGVGRRKAGVGRRQYGQPLVAQVLAR
jgi:hypothetical protein